MLSFYNKKIKLNNNINLILLTINFIFNIKVIFIILYI